MGIALGYECSRTRLEFKGISCYITFTRTMNAVAPDWNLKFLVSLTKKHDFVNAVAPDWNLKQTAHSVIILLIRMQSHQIGI